MTKDIKLVLSVDWEGLSLQEENLQRLRRFKTRRDKPVVHYMNPAYFTHGLLRKKARAELFFDCIGLDDEWGLHLHGPKHLIEAAGLGLKTQPCFSKHGESYTQEWVGQEVMLHTYSSSELSQLLSFSKQIFADQGFPQPKSFRAGGWMMNPENLDGLIQHEFLFDSSATHSHTLAGTCWEGDQLQRYISLMWDDLNPFAQPYQRESGLFEIPNNLGAIDYWQNPVDVAQSVMTEAFNGKSVWVITAHQETAQDHLDKLDEFLNLLEDSLFSVEYHTNHSLINSLQTRH